MLRLSGFQSSLLAHYTQPSRIFPRQHQDDIVQILSCGPLEDLSISRPRSRLAWGVPVPDDPEQTVYVWFDALLVYLSGVGYPWKTGMGIKSGWPVDLQIIGKDILRLAINFLPGFFT
jgi:methionyl-tRNA synthetase